MTFVMRLAPDAELVEVEVSPAFARQLGRRHAADNVDAVCRVLDRDGRFSTLLAAHHARTQPGRRFDGLLHEHFAEVLHGPPMWANVPSLRAYHCWLNARTAGRLAGPRRARFHEHR